MATIAEITSHPKWALANEDQRKFLLSKASDAPPTFAQSLKSLVTEPLPAAMRDIALAAKRDPKQAWSDIEGYIPAGAGVVGTMAGGPGAGVLAAQGADVLRRAANVAVGVDTPLDPLQIALGNVGQAAAAAPGKFVPKFVSKPALKYGGMAAKAGGDIISSALQSTTGIAKSRFPQMFRNPTIPIPIVSTIRRWMSGKGVENAIRSEGFDAPKSAKEVFDPLLSQARRTATKSVELAEGPIKGEGFTVKPVTREELGQEMVKGRRAIGRIIKGTSYKDRASIPDMIEKAKTVDSVLSELSPRVRSAMADYSEKAMANEFSNIFPLVMSGNVSYLKSMIPLFATMGGVITPAGATIGVLSSPILMGAATGMAGVINKALKVPALRNFILSQVAMEKTGE